MKRGRWLAVLLVLTLAALARLPALDADPPPDLQSSFIADEGGYAHNARQHALTGAWRLDEFNAPLYTAPLHTLLIERAYAWLGVSFAATRLPGALAGVCVALVLVWLTWGRVTHRTSLTAGVLAALCGFLVAHARVAYTESLQLAGVTLAVLGLWRARGRPGWAIVAALGTVAALAAKLSSAPVLAVVLAQWIWWGVDARARGELPGFLRSAVLFSMTLAVAGAAISAGLILPHWNTVWAEWGAMVRLAGSTGSDLTAFTRFLWFGFRDDPGGLRGPGGLFTGEPALVIAAGWLAAATLLKRRTGGDRFLVWSCWAWVVTLLAAIATHPALSPDRRYVLLVPPVLLLMALAAFEPAATVDDDDPRITPVRFAAAWAVSALVIGLYLRPLVLTFLSAALRDLPLGREAGVSARGMLALGWLGSGALAAALLRAAALRETLRPSRWFARALCAWAIAGGLAATGTQFARAGYTIRDASRAIGTTVSTDPASRRIAVGETAETFALENDLRCMVVRDWPWVGVRVNVETLGRIDPPYAIITRAGTRPVTGNDVTVAADAKILGTWPVWRGADGRPQLATTLYARDASGGATP